VVAENGSFKSETLKSGDKFERTFEGRCDYPSFCVFHGNNGGKDMAGLIRVVQ